MDVAGGLLEAGELSSEAAVRETLEESGILARGPFRLVYVSQHESPRRGGCLVVFCFETSDWDGDVVCADPDGVVFEAGFFSAPEALGVLESTAWSGMRGLRMREPLVAYLGGEAERGTLWLYRERSDDTDRLVARVSSNG